ncbi:MAG: isochorismatase family protein [Terricaulis sp.]
MPITTLDPKTALVLIDLQKGILAMAAARSIDAVLKNAVLLVDAFRARKLTVVLVNVAGGAPGRTESPRMSGAFPPDWTELAPELKAQPSDTLITKRTWGAFYNTDLDVQLKDRGITNIVLGGVSTSIGVETTARQAFERGYNVTLAIDAMTDLSEDAHANSLARIFPRLGETGSTQDVLGKLGETRA